MSPRPTVRAIIFHQGDAVLLKRTKGDRTYYVFPGGGVEKGETNEQALVREVKEEVGVDVAIERLIMELPFKGQKGEKMEYFYRCRILNGEIGTGQGAEFSNSGTHEGTFEIFLIPQKALVDLPIFPEEVKQRIISTTSRP